MEVRRAKQMTEFKCDSTTHYQGCQCHEARRNAQLAQAQARVEKLALVADAAVQLYNALSAQSGAHFEHMKAEWPELRQLKKAFAALEAEKGK